VRVSARQIACSALAAVAAALAGCASQGVPPGGPPDLEPPRLVRTSPDTGAVGVRGGEVAFQFDEVIAERPTGAATLGALFLVSPRDGEPRVTWRRDAISVRPRGGFRDNTVYTVTMLPGIVDLRGNSRTEGAEVVFSTGATIPRTSLAGVVFDWVAGNAVPRALVEALHVRDSATARDTTTYLAVADSLGRFAFRYLPPGDYTVRGAADANSNRAIDPRELYDTVRVALRDSATVELLAFAHDTVGPRLTAASASDSVTLRATFDQPLLPTQPLGPSLFALTGPDSARVPIAAVTAGRDADSLATPAGARGDSAAAAPLPTP
jgi:hypothetical protein